MLPKLESRIIRLEQAARRLGVFEPDCLASNRIQAWKIVRWRLTHFLSPLWPTGGDFSV